MKRVDFLIIATLIIMFVVIYNDTKPTTEELQRNYAAYRECIPKPHCMTAEDFIRYYEVKKQLEKADPP